MIAPDPFYLHPECIVQLFDLTVPDGAAALHRQRAIWAEFSDIEALDADHFALIVRPGWVSEAAA